jgi:hypothetical protein
MEGQYPIGIPVEDVNVKHGSLSGSSIDENNLRGYEGKKKEDSYDSYRSRSEKSIIRICSKRINAVGI